MMADHGKQRIVIVGGGYAGLLAAARIGRDTAATVTLVDAQPAFTQRIRFHEALAGATPKSLSYPAALARRGVRFVQGFVDRLDPALGHVSGRASDGAALDLGYDTLILALGSGTTAPVPGVAEHTVRLDQLATLERTARQLPGLASRSGRVLVVGGGLTGIESATELAERYPGLRVTLALSGALGDGYVPKAQAQLAQTLARLNIAVREHTSVVGVEAQQAWCADGTALPFDLCLWCGGFAAPALGRNAGLPVDALGRVVVDSTLRVAERRNIFAVGDAAAVEIAGQPLRMGCVTALPMGAYAGDTVRRLLHNEEIGEFRFNFMLRCISLGRSEGLVQFTQADDTPREAVWAGRRATYTKEAICRMTYSVVRNELRTGMRLYHWAQRN
jgi:NADH dehydrogenase FAD-containing subunit